MSKHYEFWRKYAIMNVYKFQGAFMELRDKITKAMAADFIGDIKFDESELEQIKNDCRSFYRRSQQSWSKIYRPEDIEELIVLIVNIAKTWDDDKESRFWVKLFGEIFDDASISPTKFYNEFENSLKRHGKTLFLSKENKRMFREVFLLHAFAPDKSRDSFVRLLWNWYTDTDVVGYDFQPNDPLYTEIANFLDKKFSGEVNMDEDSSFEGKTYAIKSSFKYLFTQNKEQGIKLLNTLFAFFDDIYFNGRYNDKSFYSESCYEIINRILDESNDRIKRRKRMATEHIVSDYSKIFAAYEVDDSGNAAIFIPEIRAIDELADEYELEILNDDNIIFQTQGYIVGSDLKRKIKRISIPFNSFGKQAQQTLHFRVKMYTLQSGYLKRQIYDSKESLYREFIIFRLSREIRLQNCKPNTYYVVHPSNVQLEKLTTCSDVRNINQFTSTVTTKENDYITGVTQQVFFNQQPKDSHVIIEGRNIESILFIRDDIEYPFYKSVKSLKVILDQSLKVERVIVKADNDNRFYPLSSCATNDDNTYEIDLRKINAIGNGCHTIYISDSSKQKLLHKIVYYVNNSLSFNATGNGYVFDRDTINFAIQTNNDGINRALYSCNPQSGLESLSCSFDDGQIVFALPYIKWRIDDSDEWYYGSYDSDLWREDDIIHSNCVVEIENCSRRDIALLINDEEVPVSSSGKYLLGDALTERTKNKSNDVVLRIGKSETRLFTVYNKPFLSDIDIDLDNKRIDLLPYYIGDALTQFLIVLENEDNRYEITSGVSSTFDADIVDGEYTVSVYIVDFFGELEAVPIFEEDCIIGNPDKFYFAHSRIILNSFKKPEGGKIRLSNVFITDIRYLREETIGAVYSGFLICNKKRFSVEVYKKGNSSLKFYIVDGDRLLPANFNTEKNEFVKDQPNEKNVIPCSSCYYTKEVV